MSSPSELLHLLVQYTILRSRFHVLALGFYGGITVQFGTKMKTSNSSPMHRGQENIVTYPMVVAVGEEGHSPPVPSFHTWHFRTPRIYGLIILRISWEHLWSIRRSTSSPSVSKASKTSHALLYVLTKTSITWEAERSCLYLTWWFLHQLVHPTLILLSALRISMPSTLPRTRIYPPHHRNMIMGVCYPPRWQKQW